MVSLKKSTPITFQVYPITPKKHPIHPNHFPSLSNYPQKKHPIHPQKTPPIPWKKIPTAKIRIFIHISTMGHIIFC